MSGRMSAKDRKLAFALMAGMGGNQTLRNSRFRWRSELSVGSSGVLSRVTKHWSDGRIRGSHLERSASLGHILAEVAGCAVLTIVNAKRADDDQR